VLTIAAAAYYLSQYYFADCFFRRAAVSVLANQIMRPVLLDLFGVPLYSYGFMLLLSVLIGRLLALKLAERAGINRNLADRCALWTLIGAIAGSRLLFVVTNLDEFSSVLDVFAWWKGGVVAYGGFLGGLAGAIVFCRMHGMRLLPWADSVVPSLCLGLALTRIGCFLGGCDFGRDWNGPWAVQFPAGSQASIQQARLGLLPSAALESLPVHPTQLYEVLAGIALLLLVIAVRRRHLLAGHALAAFAMGYAVLRYLIEIVRADPGRGTIGPWSTSQFIAIVTFVAAAALLYGLRRKSAGPSNLAPAV
jgi:phosphatidylglycerol:prolipoprotein diacylglycerol transferase